MRVRVLLVVLSVSAIAFAAMGPRGQRALAATPDHGSVSAASPTMTWDFAPVFGQAPDGGTVADQCSTLPAQCDPFALTVDPTAPVGQVAKLTIVYTWTSTTLEDLDVFAYNPGATSRSGPGTPDNIENPGKETLTIRAPAAGVWSIRSVAAVTTAPTPAHAVATLTFAPPPTSSNVTPGAQTLNNYDFPVAYQTRDKLNRPNAGEPNIDANWASGNTMYMSGTQVTRINWDDTQSPPAPRFTDVTPLGQAQVNEDAILTIDHNTNRTHVAGLLVAGSNISLSDNDGASWTQGTFPVPHSPDHETINGGPYHQPPPPGAGLSGYPDAVYYCSQNILQAAGAFCGRSDTGGVTWNTSTPVFVNTDCGAIHGHVKIGPDGTVYLPQRNCGGLQGMAVSFDNGANWFIEKVPDSSTIGIDSSDPSVAAAPDGKTLYYAYQDGFGGPAVAVSSDHGKDGTWSPSTLVGTPFGIKNTKFPQMVVGDTNRAAVTFLGTTTPGNDQQGSKDANGNPNPKQFKGTWYLYVSFTYDGGKTWTTVNATPNDPVQRGCIWMAGGSNACRNLLDFNEITVDGHGRVEVAYTDGCTADCVTTNRIDDSGCVGSQGASYLSTPTCTYGRLSAVVRQQCGLGLFSKFDDETRRRCGGGGGGGGGSCREGDGEGRVHGKDRGEESFRADADKCEEKPALGGGDQSREAQVESRDPGSGMDFRSTSVTAVTFDDSTNTLVMVGQGLDNGRPVTFTAILVDKGIPLLDTFSLVLSDGYSNAGTLISGSVQLK